MNVVQSSTQKTNAAAKQIKAAFKTLKRKTLDNVAQNFFDAKVANGGKRPHSYVPSIIIEMKAL